MTGRVGGDVVSELAKLITTVEEHTVDDHIGHHGWGRIAKKLLKYLYYFMARSRVWKRAAKEHRIWELYFQDSAMRWQKLAYVQTSTATRRKELLREWDEMLNQLGQACMFCGQYKCTADCELAGELADDHD